MRARSLPVPAGTRATGPTSRSSPRSCRHCATEWTVPSPPTTTTRRPSGREQGVAQLLVRLGVHRRRRRPCGAAGRPPRTPRRHRRPGGWPGRGRGCAGVWSPAQCGGPAGPRLARSGDDRSRRRGGGLGVVGASVALAMARQGRSVEVVDRGPGPGYGSTSASSAIVRFNYSTFAGVALSWDSRAAWEVWTEHLGHRDPDGVPRSPGAVWRCSTSRTCRGSAARPSSTRWAWRTSTGTPRPSPTGCPASTPGGGSRRDRSPTTPSSTTPHGRAGRALDAGRRLRRRPAAGRGEPAARRRRRAAPRTVRARCGRGRAATVAGGGCGSTTATVSGRRRRERGRSVVPPVERDGRCGSRLHRRGASAAAGGAPGADARRPAGAGGGGGAPISPTSTSAPTCGPSAARAAGRRHRAGLRPAGVGRRPRRRRRPPDPRAVRRAHPRRRGASRAARAQPPARAWWVSTT